MDKRNSLLLKIGLNIVNRCSINFNIKMIHKIIIITLLFFSSFVYSQELDTTLIYTQTVQKDLNKTVLPYVDNLSGRQKSFIKYTGQELIVFQIHSWFVWKPFTNLDYSVAIDTFRIEKSEINNQYFVKIDNQKVLFNKTEKNAFELVYPSYSQAFNPSLDFVTSNCKISELENFLIGKSFSLNIPYKNYGRTFLFQKNKSVHISADGIDFNTPYSIVRFDNLLFLIGLDAPIFINKIEDNRIFGVEIYDRFNKSHTELIPSDTISIIQPKLH